MSAQKQPRILIVDDDPGFRNVYKDVMKSGGYDTIEAPNGLQGLNICRAEPPDAVLLDLVMPEMNGFDFLREMKESDETRNIPVLVLSVMGEKNKVEQAMALGAASVLTKGYDRPKDVLLRVNQTLGFASANPTYRFNLPGSASETIRLAGDLKLEKGLSCATCQSNYQLEVERPTTSKLKDPMMARLICRCSR